MLKTCHLCKPAHILRDLRIVAELMFTFPGDG